MVRVTTDQGLEGFGITYHEVGGEATRYLVLKSIAPKLIGRDPFDTEVIWQEMFGYLRGVDEGLTFGALSAIDIALWDLKGKACGLPLYKPSAAAQRGFPSMQAGDGPRTTMISSWTRCWTW